MALINLDGDIAGILGREIAAQLQTAIDKALPGILSRLKALLSEALKASLEYQAIEAGKLRGELGLVNAAEALEASLNALLGSVELVRYPIVYNGSLSGGFSLRASRSDCSDVLATPLATFLSEGGFQIDWLAWLLTKGDETVVLDYRFKEVGAKYSRTGIGLMVPKGTWRVPPEYSGTKENNWLTRAFAQVGDKAVAIVIEEILGAL